VRKIIHVDMDAFCASVEQRDDPQLRGKPVVVAWKGNRSVVCAASYEATTFGVRSAMPAVRAERLCPAAIFVAPDFTRYRAVSNSVREIFKPIKTVGDLRAFDLSWLEAHFGRYGLRLHGLARGIDESEVVPDRPTQSISVEDTFERDVPLSETEPMIRRLVEKLWSASRKESRVARTVVLKLKTSEFKVLTRSHTPSTAPSSCQELTAIALLLRERVDVDPEQRYRLVGVGLSNFREPEGTMAQPVLFE
jgi:nucleotidyltransferase/DNA polymerase involved in DNA repair